MTPSDFSPAGKRIALTGRRVENEFTIYPPQSPF